MASEIAKIHNMVMEDRILKMSEIAKALGILNDHVHNILHENLRMKKVHKMHTIFADN